MRPAWPLIFVALLVAGCADGGGPSSADPSPSPSPPEVLVVEDAPAGHPLGITNQTPLVVMGPGRWDVTFEGAGTRQFVLRLTAGLSPRGYSIGGQLALLVVPTDFTFGACAPSDINFLATGVGGFSQTWSTDLPAGDYLVVVHYVDDASGSFTWQVGDSDEEQAHDAEGEPSRWRHDLVEPPMNGGDFEAVVPGGFHFLSFRASTGTVTQSSSTRHEVGPGGACHAAEEAGTIDPLGSGTTLVMHTQSADPVAWSGHFEAQSVLPPTSDPVARGVVLAPPA